LGMLGWSTEPALNLGITLILNVELTTKVARRQSEPQTQSLTALEPKWGDDGESLERTLREIL
jgi:hypothetical protein